MIDEDIDDAESDIEIMNVKIIDSEVKTKYPDRKEMEEMIIASDCKHTPINVQTMSEQQILNNYRGITRRFGNKTFHRQKAAKLTNHMTDSTALKDILNDHERDAAANSIIPQLIMPDLDRFDKVVTDAVPVAVVPPLPSINDSYVAAVPQAIFDGFDKQSADRSFEHKMKVCGLFGNDKVNVKQINHVSFTMIFSIVKNKFEYKLYRAGKITPLGRRKKCLYESRLGGKCMACHPAPKPPITVSVP